MIGDHDPVNAERSCPCRIVGMHDPLQDQVARPKTAERLDVRPKERRRRLASYEIGHLIPIGARRCVLLPVREQRQANLEIFPHPAWMEAGFELGFQRHLERTREAVANIALTFGVDWYVDGYHQRAEAGVTRAPDLVLGNLAILGDIELIPAVLWSNFCQILDGTRS